jgi:hypothetical protein
MNFNPYFPHLLPDLGEILYRSALDAAKQCNTKTQEGGVDQSAVTKVRARRKSSVSAEVIIFTLPTASRPALQLILPPTECVPWLLPWK